jgi:hypothetical protein
MCTGCCETPHEAVPAGAMRRKDFLRPTCPGRFDFDKHLRPIKHHK